MDKDEVLERLQVDGQTLQQVQVEASFSQPNAGMCQNMLSWARSCTGGWAGVERGWLAGGYMAGCNQGGSGAVRAGQGGSCGGGLRPKPVHEQHARPVLGPYCQSCAARPPAAKPLSCAPPA